MKRKLHIHFAPRQGGAEGGGSTLEIFDDASCGKILSVDLTYAQTGQFVQARGLAVEADVSDNLDRVGKVREHKKVPMNSIKGMGSLSSPEGIYTLTRLAAVHEVDGWKVDAGGYVRSQKQVTPEGIPLVPFYRFVNEEPTS